MSLAEQYAAYNQTIKEISRYLSVNGMFEYKDGQTYATYDGINENAFTWKQYDLESTLRYNERDMWELVFNTSDVTFLGSGNTIAKMPEVISRLQLVVNTSLLEYAAYFEGCQGTPSCSDVLSATNAEILNAHYEDAYDAVARGAATVADWEAARAKAAGVYAISQGPLDSL